MQRSIGIDLHGPEPPEHHTQPGQSLFWPPEEVPFADTARRYPESFGMGAGDGCVGETVTFRKEDAI